mmetsp:Transcript_7464/g.15969  ORF Transcript_7464/g.15969 Transcript_7464/m.15969 type:complete len:228 (+) Transcript_7464:3-686(+)
MRFKFVSIDQESHVQSSNTTMNSFPTNDPKVKNTDSDPNNAVQDIANSLKETLCRTGTIANIRAQLRAEIYHCMSESLATLASPSMYKAAIADDPNNQTSTSNNFDIKPLTPPIENVLINEIIADYLAFNGYHNTLSVFSAEARTPSLQSSGWTTRPCYDSVYNPNNLNYQDESEQSVLGMKFIREELGLDDDSTARSKNNKKSSMAVIYDIVETMKASRRSKTQRH